MLAHAALVLKDIFALRFASIQAILDSVDFFMKITKYMYFGLNFQVLAAVCYLLVSSLLCSYSVKWDR